MQQLAIKAILEAKVYNISETKISSILMQELVAMNLALELAENTSKRSRGR